MDSKEPHECYGLSTVTLFSWQADPAQGGARWWAKSDSKPLAGAIFVGRPSEGRGCSAVAMVGMRMGCRLPVEVCDALSQAKTRLAC